MSKWVAVRDWVTGQEGRLVPDSMRPSEDYPEAVDLQIVPKGLLGFYKKVWIRGIPKTEGYEIVVPSDTSLEGVEPQYFIIIRHLSDEKMRHSIVGKMKVFAQDTIKSLLDTLETERMNAAHLRAVANEKTQGAKTELRELKKAEGILSKDTKKEDERPRRYAGLDNAGENYGE